MFHHPPAVQVVLHVRHEKKWHVGVPGQVNRMIFFCWAFQVSRSRVNAFCYWLSFITQQQAAKVVVMR